MEKFHLFCPHLCSKDGCPLSPVVSVIVGDCFSSQGRTHLSPDLMTDSEIDYAFDSLVGELESKRKLAKSKLRETMPRRHSN